MKPIFKVDIKPNKSKTYMLPLLMKHVNIGFLNLMQNTYLSFQEGDDLFCVLYHWTSSHDFLKFEGELMEHPMYAGHADYGDRVLYKFNITHDMKKARQLMIDGNLKGYSDVQKQIIGDYVSERGFKNADRIKNILSSNGELTSAAPDMESETSSKQISKLIIKPDTFL